MLFPLGKDHLYEDSPCDVAKRRYRRTSRPSGMSSLRERQKNFDTTLCHQSTHCYRAIAGVASVMATRAAAHIAMCLSNLIVDSSR